LGRGKGGSEVRRYEGSFDRKKRLYIYAGPNEKPRNSGIPVRFTGIEKEDKQEKGLGTGRGGGLVF